MVAFTMKSTVAMEPPFQPSPHRSGSSGGSAALRLEHQVSGSPLAARKPAGLGQRAQPEHREQAEHTAHAQDREGPAPSSDRGAPTAEEVEYPSEREPRDGTAAEAQQGAHGERRPQSLRSYRLGDPGRVYRRIAESGKAVEAPHGDDEKQRRREHPAEAEGAGGAHEHHRRDHGCAPPAVGQRAADRRGDDAHDVEEGRKRRSKTRGALGARTLDGEGRRDEGWRPRPHAEELPRVEDVPSDHELGWPIAREVGVEAEPLARSRLACARALASEERERENEA